MMNEELLQLIWANGLFNMDALSTNDGLSIQIKNRGRLNTHSGPDFNHSRIVIDGTEWIGDVEIHLSASEWEQHKHHLDKAYNTCILHVVLDNNAKCFRADQTELPCLELKNRIYPGVAEQYEYFKFSKDSIPCHNALPSIRHIDIRQAIDQAMVSRLERKSDWVFEWLNISNGDWHSVFLAALTRSFGFGTNSQAFEVLALNLPMKEICKSENNFQKISAIVFGVAGFLDEAPKDIVQAKLFQEWEYQKKKLQLNSIDKSIFKFMRMRPGNFPGIRLAQLSALLQNFQSVMYGLMQALSIPSMLNLLDIELPEYWTKHYQFGDKEGFHQSKLSISARQTLLINALVPFLFVYGKQTGDENYCVKALDLLQKLPPENNRIIRDWNGYGVECTSAFDSQALIELRQQSCLNRRCMSCPIGLAIILKRLH